MTSLLTRAFGRADHGGRDDSGFSLVEAVIALLIVTVAFMALAASGLVAVRSSLTGRTNQQAVDFAARELERLRLTPYAQLAMSTADATIATDGAIATIAACGTGTEPCVDPGTGVPEPLVLAAGGIVTPHRQVLQNAETNRIAYTLTTFVTRPADSTGAAYKRVTVRASWSVYGQTRTKAVSSIVSPNRRGLPLPVFTFTPVGSSAKSANPGTAVVYGFKLTNQGAPDRWEISQPGSWSLLLDNGDGVFDEAQDVTPLGDLDADGVLDTGRIDPTESVVFWAFKTAGTTVGTTNETFTATSVAQSAAVSASHSLPTTTTITNGTITGPTPTPTSSSTSTPVATDCSWSTSVPVAAPSTGGYKKVGYNLRNVSVGGNSTAQATLNLTPAAPAATTLYNYSTDLHALGGRQLDPGGLFTSTSPNVVADWSYPVGAVAYSGTAVIRLWVAAIPTTNVTLQAKIYTKQGSGAKVEVASIPIAAASFPCSGFQEMYASSAAFTVARMNASDVIGVRLINSGAEAVRVAYDVSTLYPASIVLPEK